MYSLLLSKKTFVKDNIMLYLHSNKVYVAAF